jgi:GTP cyclohydrolase II
VERVRLLTNNPEKVDGLQKAGITVAERLPLKIAANPHNAHYLETKKSRTGHAL